MLLNKNDCVKLNLNEGDIIEFEVSGQSYRLPVKCSTSIVAGVAGLPIGLNKISYADLPAWGIRKKQNG